MLASSHHTTGSTPGHQVHHDSTRSTGSSVGYRIEKFDVVYGNIELSIYRIERVLLFAPPRHPRGF